eukprot:3761912-Prymnesium_polylepis.1
MMGQNASAHAGSVGPYVHILPRLRERFAHIPDQDLESFKSIFLYSTALSQPGQRPPRARRSSRAPSRQAERQRVEGR